MPIALPELAGVSHEFHELPTGVRAHVALAGPADAPPLLLLHGWPQHWWCWRRVVPLLAGDYRLLMPDLRAFGWSSAPRDGDLRKQRLADDAVALLDVLGIERAGFIGHDWGAWAGFRAVLTTPERWTALLATSIAHPWVARTVAARNAHRLAYQLPIATPGLGPRLLREPAVVLRVIKSGWRDRSSWNEAEMRPFADALAQPGQAEASSRLYRVFLTRELLAPPPAPRLAVPARLLFGERDQLGTALAGGLDRHGDDAATELVPGCGHFLPEERPETLAAAARAVF